MKSRIVLSSALLAALATAPALALNNPIVVDLKTPNGASASGSATIFQAGPKLLVNVTLTGGMTGAGVDIASGTCAKIGDTAFKLTQTASGRSTTEMNELSAKIANAPHALVVRKTTDDSSPVVACGNIKG